MVGALLNRKGSLNGSLQPVLLSASALYGGKSLLGFEHVGVGSSSEGLLSLASAGVLSKLERAGLVRVEQQQMEGAIIPCRLQGSSLEGRASSEKFHCPRWMTQGACQPWLPVPGTRSLRKGGHARKASSREKIRTRHGKWQETWLPR